MGVRGRKKIQNPKTEVIRISLGLRRELALLKNKLGMPTRYTEHDVIQAAVRKASKEAND